MSSQSSRSPVPEETVIGYFDSMSNWGRWGAEDELGLLNLITPAKVAQAVRLVEHGQRVSCSRPVEFAPKPSSVEAPLPPMHFMQTAGDLHRSRDMVAAMDWVGFPLHGLYMTHLDAPSHMIWKGRTYNGFLADRVGVERGAEVESVDVAKDGIVSRGVLLDVARARGVQWLEDGDAITDLDLERAEQLAQVQVEPGDIMLVRTGYGARRPGSSTRMPGLIPESLPFLHAREPAVLATDTGTDLLPSPYPSMEGPVHVVSMVAMGMWIIDNCDFEALSAVCNRLGRWQVMIVIAGLRLVGATASPVNPIAVF